MGLFDFMNTGDPEKDSMIREGLLQFGLGLMSSRGRTLPAIGNAGRQSLSAMDAYQNNLLKRKQAGLQQQMTEAQLKEFQRKAEEAAGQRARTEQAVGMFPQVQIAQGPPDEANRFPTVKPTEDDYLNYAIKAYPLDPALAQFGWKAAESVAGREDKQSAAAQAQSAAAAARLEQQKAADAARMERLREQMAAEERLKKTLAAMRPERAEPAPTMRTIVDPTDPNRMIDVDARSYAGGGLGSRGVLGIAGKDPAAALRQNKATEGKTALSEMLDTLRASYDNLDQNKEITSKDRSVAENALAWTKASSVGQLAGRIVGSEAQSERNKITQTRPLLINAIKQATGMSAQQLNSNIELKTMLQAATDPSLDIEANRAALDQLERIYIKGEAKAATRPSGAPKAGDVMDGYRFKGGNPADKANWERVP